MVEPTISQFVVGDFQASNPAEPTSSTHPSPALASCSSSAAEAGEAAPPAAASKRAANTRAKFRGVVGRIRWLPWGCFGDGHRGRAGAGWPGQLVVPVAERQEVSRADAAG